MVATENNAGECYMLHMEEQFDLLSTLDVECDRLPMDEKLPDTLGSAKTTWHVQGSSTAFPPLMVMPDFFLEPELELLAPS